MLSKCPHKAQRLAILAIVIAFASLSDSAVGKDADKIPVISRGEKLIAAEPAKVTQSGVVKASVGSAGNGNNKVGTASVVKSPAATTSASHEVKTGAPAKPVSGVVKVQPTLEVSPLKTGNAGTSTSASVGTKNINAPAKTPLSPKQPNASASVVNGTAKVHAEPAKSAGKPVQGGAAEPGKGAAQKNKAVVQANAHISAKRMMVPPPPPDIPLMQNLSVDHQMSSTGVVLDYLSKPDLERMKVRLESAFNKAVASKEEQAASVKEKTARVEQFEQLYKEGVVSRRELEGAHRELNEVAQSAKEIEQHVSDARFDLDRANKAMERFTKSEKPAAQPSGKKNSKRSQ
jgi:hypothetical protein